jgi:hypothetical protein
MLKPVHPSMMALDPAAQICGTEDAAGRTLWEQVPRSL